LSGVALGKEKITEVTAADYLEQKRREIPEFLDLSFPTIDSRKLYRILNGL